MTQRTDLLEVLSELVDAIEPYAQSHKFDTPCDCCLCTAIANAEVALASHAPSEAAAQPKEVPVDDKYFETFGGAPNENWSDTTIDSEGVAWVLRSEAEVRIAEALLHPETWNKAEIEHNDQLTEKHICKPTAHTDEQIAVLVGALIREIYGDSAELGHYKLAIAAYKLGQSDHQPTPVHHPEEK